jgi:hypothetical protein
MNILTGQGVLWMMRTARRIASRKVTAGRAVACWQGSPGPRSGCGLGEGVTVRRDTQGEHHTREAVGDDGRLCVVGTVWPDGTGHAA